MLRERKICLSLWNQKLIKPKESLDTFLAKHLFGSRMMVSWWNKLFATPISSRKMMAHLLSVPVWVQFLWSKLLRHFIIHKEKSSIQLQCLLISIQADFQNLLYYRIRDSIRSKTIALVSTKSLFVFPSTIQLDQTTHPMITLKLLWTGQALEASVNQSLRWMKLPS